MSKMEEQPTLDPSISEEQLRLRKLRREVEELEDKRKWYNRLLGYIPFLTTLVAVIGLTLTASGFFSDRQKERESRERENQARAEEQRTRNENLQRDQRIRDDNQIRNNIDQLFSAEEKHSTAKVPYLLADLAELIKRRPAEEQKVLEQRITETIVRFISRDAELLTPKNVRTDTHSIDHWPGYKDYLVRLCCIKEDERS